MLGTTFPNAKAGPVEENMESRRASNNIVMEVSVWHVHEWKSCSNSLVYIQVDIVL